MRSERSEHGIPGPWGLSWVVYIVYYPLHYSGIASLAPLPIDLLPLVVVVLTTLLNLTDYVGTDPGGLSSFETNILGTTCALKASSLT